VVIIFDVVRTGTHNQFDWSKNETSNLRIFNAIESITAPILRLHHLTIV